MAKQKMTQRQSDALKTKKKIFKVAIDLMTKNGFDNTTIEEISKKAKVSVGAFYHHYKSKNDIIFELYKIADDYFRDEVAQQLTEDNFADRIVAFFRFYARYNSAQGLDYVKQLYNTKNKLFIAKGRYMHELLEQIIVDGQERNKIFLDMTAESIAEYLFIVARGIVYEWCLHDADFDLEDTMVKYLERLIGIFKINS